MRSVVCGIINVRITRAGGVPIRRYTTVGRRRGGAEQGSRVDDALARVDSGRSSPTGTRRMNLTVGYTPYGCHSVFLPAFRLVMPGHMALAQAHQAI